MVGTGGKRGIESSDGSWEVGITGAGRGAGGLGRLGRIEPNVDDANVGEGESRWRDESA